MNRPAEPARREAPGKPAPGAEKPVTIAPLAGAPLLAHIDGGARGNPGDAGYGVYLTLTGGEEVAEVWGFLGTRTNNFAEYVALLAALTYAVRAGAGSLTVRSDSELLVRQLHGIYKVKHPGLQVLHRRARALIGRLPGFQVSHVRREQNKDADRLANRAMDERDGSGHFRLEEILEGPEGEAKRG